MNFQQLRSVREAVRCGFNLTEVAALLFTSQPGVSRQIRELEEELGIEIFVRAGKRLTGLTPPGHAVLPIVERLLQDADNLKRAGLDYSSSQEGRLSIAATHSQARYALPHVVRDFRAMFPQVSLHLHQGSPKQVAEMLLSGEADIGVATEALSHYDALVTLPCYRWTHSVVLPPGGPAGTATETGALCERYVHAMGAFGTAPGQIDTLVLGCTHYIFVADELRALVGPEVRFIETGEPVARQTRRLLETAGLLGGPDSVPGSIRLLTTGPVAMLQAAAQRWLDLPADCCAGVGVPSSFIAQSASSA